MTTLYRPVLIESDDLPMDKFPEGTVATHPDHWPVERCSCSRWESDGPDRYDPDMVGWTALVPIEAEETKVRGFATLDDQSITVTVKTGLPPEKIRIGDGLIVAPGTRWEEA